MKVDLAGHGSVHAMLGPTNTGKTHVAIQRMLAHRTGMIGLPLRLLAREVYDRVVAEVGADAVALVTGEEKRVPAAPRYWVCTVESMPVDRPVAFLAVDEIQLAGDPARGHVFTDRLLNARGVAETWFLGSDTIAPLVERLVPTAVRHSQPRLSSLRHSGHRKLRALPPRSAVVAFRAADVYALAEQLRARHGGVAVVLGALSPRARNAQVGLYQEGRVAHLVATDAIGMGLNLDVHHVALAGLEKFDGRVWRRLRDDELAQIAGRAGRYRRDGTFGTAGRTDPLDGPTIEAIEGHRFAPLTRLFWRNADLDFSAPRALLTSLELPPPRGELTAAAPATDLLVLRQLLADPELAAAARDPAVLRVVWDAACVPDFGNTLAEHHAGLVRQILDGLLAHDGVLPDDALARPLRRLGRTDADADTLMARLAGVRTWTYVVHRPGWVSDARHWQERLAAVEDALSDALHERLTARFVDTHAALLVRGLDEVGAARLVGTEVRVGDAVVGALHGLDLTLDPAVLSSAAITRAARAAVAPVVAARTEAVVGAPDEAFAVRADGAVTWDGAAVARLVRGERPEAPRLSVRRLDALDGVARGRVVQRLERWLGGWLAAVDAPVAALPAEDAASRALRFALRAGGGAVRVEAVAEALRALPGPVRASWLRLGVRFGHTWLTLPARLARTLAGAAQWAAWSGEEVALPDDPRHVPALTPAAAAFLGYERASQGWVRVDVGEALRAGGAPAAAALGLPLAALPLEGPPGPGARNPAPADAVPARPPRRSRRSR